MRPFTLINVAPTADGKLAPANRRFVPFGSARDLELLYELRAGADAVIAGARTVDAAPGHFGPGPVKFRRLRLQRGLSEFNLRIVVSGAGTLNPRAEIFRHRFSPIIVLVSGAAPAAKVRKLAAVADEVKRFGGRQLDFKAAFEWLRQRWKIKRLVCEGGGELNAALLQNGLVDDIYETICPLLFGGRHAPTPVDGRSVNSVKEAIRLRLKSSQRVGQELFLVYRVLNRGRK